MVTTATDFAEAIDALLAAKLAADQEYIEGEREMREWLDLKHGSTPYTTSLDEAKDNDESGAKQQDDSETDSPNNDDHDKDERVRVVERECLLPVMKFMICRLQNVRGLCAGDSTRMRTLTSFPRSALAVG